MTINIVRLYQESKSTIFEDKKYSNIKVGLFHFTKDFLVKNLTRSISKFIWKKSKCTHSRPSPSQRFCPRPSSASFPTPRVASPSREAENRTSNENRQENNSSYSLRGSVEFCLLRIWDRRHFLQARLQGFYLKMYCCDRKQEKKNSIARVIYIFSQQKVWEELMNSIKVVLWWHL